MIIEQNSIEIEYINFHSFFKDKEIGIPIFQRFFDWKKQQVHELLNDIDYILNGNTRTIYLLDFIYYDEDGKIKLADGQQRLVSINIFRKALCDFIDENKLDITKPSLYNISYDVAEYNKKYLNSFSNYMQAPFKILYIFFKEFLENKVDKIEEIINILDNKIFIFAKKCKTADDSFLVFQQINTGGKGLTKEEIIKTSIDQYSEIYNIKLNKVTTKELKTSIVGYYKYLINGANDNFDNIAIMDFLKKYVVTTKNTFQKFVNTLEIMKNISSNSIYHVIKYINRPQLFDILNVLAMKGIDLKTQRDYLTKVMAPLCLLSICLTMKKSNPGGIIKSLYASVISMIKNGESASNISGAIAAFINNNSELCRISLTDFINALGSPDLNMGVKKGLLILDVILKNVSSDVIIDNINLEHIYPQKPCVEWSINAWPTDRDEQKNLISNIGNFLLLNEEINKKIKNSYIDVKVVQYKNIIPKDLSLQTKLNTVDFNKFENDKEKYIYERQKYIGEYIKDNFPLGVVLIK